jgi:carboxymethylenebutenolidase
MTQANPRQNVTFPSNGNQAHGYLATPNNDGGPGVIVVQEWWGLDDHIVDICDRLAAEGFVALAPDLFGGRVTHDADEAGELLASLPEDQAARDLGGAVDYLLGLPAVTGEKVGAVGFCMGGGFVLALAAQQGDRIGAAVAYYGVGYVPQDFSTVSAAVLGHYGEQDQMYPVEQARELEAKLKAQAKGPVTMYYYPAGHAFNNEQNHIGTHDPESAALAWRRTIDFLHEQLG